MVCSLVVRGVRIVRFRAERWFTELRGGHHYLFVFDHPAIKNSRMERSVIGNRHVGFVFIYRGAAQKINGYKVLSFFRATWASSELGYFSMIFFSSNFALVLSLISEKAPACRSNAFGTLLPFGYFLMTS